MNVWSAEWPTEPGWYWFTGRAAIGSTAKLDIVRAHRTATGSLVCIASGGRFLEENNGWWMRLDEPMRPPDWSRQ